MSVEHLNDLADAMDTDDASEKSCTYLYVHPSLRASRSSSRTRSEAGTHPSRNRWERLIAAVLSEAQPSRS